MSFLTQFFNFVETGKKTWENTGEYIDDINDLADNTVSRVQGGIQDVIENATDSTIDAIQNLQPELKKTFDNEIKYSEVSKDNKPALKAAMPTPGEHHTSIDDFMATAFNDKFGIASPNKYKAEFFLPRGIGGSDFAGNQNIPFLVETFEISDRQNSDARKVSLMCSEAQFPSKSFQTLEHRHNNLTMKLPYAAVYEDASFTFICTENMVERNFFAAWIESVYNVIDGTLNFYDEYTGKIIVHQLDKNGDSQYEITLYEAYPVSLNTVEFSSAANNEIQKMTVTFAYRIWSNNAL